jgi:hypothetical protein
VHIHKDDGTPLSARERWGAWLFVIFMAHFFLPHFGWWFWLWLPIGVAGLILMPRGWSFRRRRTAA